MTAVPEGGYQAQRKATAINDLLARIGVSDANATPWWSHHAYPGKNPHASLNGRRPRRSARAR
jgi:hypothetical protein